MADQEEEAPRAKLAWAWNLIGPLALLAWFAMLWFMFGDVL